VHREGEAVRRPLLLLALTALVACEKSDPNVWQGYVEGEYAMLASPYAGQLQKLYVKRGEQVESGKPVFALEQEQERAMRAEAEERVKSAQARLENLKEARRPPEVDALREQVNAARAAREFSRTQLTRAEDLMKKGYTTKPKLDEARSAYQRDVARVKESEAQLKNAQMPVGRSQEREAAEAEMAAAKAAAAQAQWRLEQKSVLAPVSGLVQDTFYVEGEWVAAGRAVASILPPANVKARFYVPEAVVSGIQIGQAVEISCDGCQPIEAKVSYVSSQAEYTPPVLYSKESRSKLVFLVEARLPKAQLRPGQPIDVRLK
jgi:HlyD family secretion protein